MIALWLLQLIWFTFDQVIQLTLCTTTLFYSWLDGSPMSRVKLTLSVITSYSHVRQNRNSYPHSSAINFLQKIFIASEIWQLGNLLAVKEISNLANSGGLQISPDQCWPYCRNWKSSILMAWHNSLVFSLLVWELHHHLRQVADTCSSYATICTAFQHYDRTGCDLWKLLHLGLGSNYSTVAWAFSRME